MIVLICHGETEDSRDKKVPVWGYNKLTDSGFQTAYDYYEALSGVTFDRMYSSPTRAARTTADIVTPYRPAGSLEDIAMLREPSGGTYEGKYYSDLKRFLPPREYRLWDRDFFSSPPSGESIADVNERLFKWFDETIKPNMATKSILISCGPVVMKLLVGKIRNLEDSDIALLDLLLIPYMFDGKISE